jgi:hypothetical protein
MTDSTASSSWENYHVAGEHTNITNLFLNTFQKWYIFFEIFAGGMKILDAGKLDNQEFIVYLYSMLQALMYYRSF